MFKRHEQYNHNLGKESDQCHVSNLKHYTTCQNYLATLFIKIFCVYLASHRSVSKYLASNFLFNIYHFYTFRLLNLPVSKIMTRKKFLVEKIDIKPVILKSCDDKENSILRKSCSSNKSFLKVVGLQGIGFQQCLLFFLSWILFTKVSEGESHSISFGSSLPLPFGIKGESEKFTLSKFQSKSEQTVATVSRASTTTEVLATLTSQNGSKSMNYSSSFSTISGEMERFDGENRLSRRQQRHRQNRENYSATRKSRNIRMSTNVRRRKRGFFDKGQEKQRLEEEYDRSFRLFWFLGGVAIVFFILIFILTLLCFCCPNLAKDKKGRKSSSTATIPRISIPTVDGLDVDAIGLTYQPSPGRIDVEMRMRSPSVISVTGHPYLSHHRLSQEQVNAIQLQSQVRRNSALPSTSQGLLPTSSALIDVNVIQEYRPEVS